MKQLLPLVALAAGCGFVHLHAAVAPIPFLYSTDLFHPFDDPDDHFDLATVYALPELDVKGVILDQGRDQGARPGSVAVSQMNALTGRTIPSVRGLFHPLRYPEDTGEDDPGGAEGVELILRTLRAPDRPVRLMAVGSLRDVAAAYNRDPALFRQKAERIYVVAGHSGGKLLEWNTALDPQAYLQIMRSNLPVYWVPCFSAATWKENQASDKIKTEPHQSFWSFRQSALMEGMPPGLQNFFLYALGRIAPAQEDPLGYLSKPWTPRCETSIM